MGEGGKCITSLLPVNEGAREACPLADDAFGSGVVVLSSRAFDRGIAPYLCTTAAWLNYGFLGNHGRRYVLVDYSPATRTTTTAANVTLHDG